MHRQRLAQVLLIDALANAAGGTALLAGGGWLAPQLGLGASWPLHLVGALLLAYGLENGLVARRPTPSRLAGLIAIDVGFAAVMLGLLFSNPAGAAVWVLAALASAGTMSLGFGIAKEIGRRSLVGKNLRSGSSPSSTSAERASRPA